MDAATPGSIQAGVPAIAVSGLGKTFATGSAAVVALDDVSLSVDQGEFVLLMGPSGSGKTTLLSIMGCLLRPTSGVVRVAGRDVTGLGEKELAKIRLVHIGFIFQSYNLFPTLTAQENVMVALDLKAVSRVEAREQAAEVMDTVGLGSKLASYPSDLSGGQKQRLAIARALAGRPGIILADEPTAALDSKSGRNVMAILHDLAKTQGRTVAIVTHDNRILDFADRIIRIEDGRIGNGPYEAE